MAKPEFCPALGTPPVVDEKTGAVKSGVMVKCKGTSCPLFRKADQSCVLGVVETVGATTALEFVEEDDSTLEAVERLERLIADRGDEIEKHVDELAKGIRSDSRRFEEALADIVQSLNRVSNAMEGFTRASRGFEKLRDKLEKEARAAEDREEAWNLFQEGQAHLRAGRVSPGVRALRRAEAKGDAAPASTAAALGAGLLLGGENDDAIRKLTQAAEADVSAPAPQANLAHAHARAGRWDAAEEAAREAIRRDPRCGAAWNTLGNALFARGETPEAVKSWERAVEVEPGLDAAWENLSRQGLVSTYGAVRRRGNPLQTRLRGSTAI